MLDVGSRVWHLDFYKSGQCIDPGRVVDTTGQESLVEWPDGTQEWYSSYELSTVLPRLLDRRSRTR